MTACVDMRSASRSPPRVAVAEEVAFRLCNDVVNCLADRSFAKLHACALRALKLTATVSILETTGIGVLINDKSIWELSPDRETSSLAAKTATKWRQLYRGAQLPVNECLSLPGERVARPLGGFSGRAFLSKVVDVMAEFEKEEPTAASRTLSRPRLHWFSVDSTRCASWMAWQGRKSRGGSQARRRQRW